MEIFAYSNDRITGTSYDINSSIRKPIKHTEVIEMNKDLWAIWPDGFMCPMHEIHSWLSMGNCARSDDYYLVEVTEYDEASLPSKWRTPLN